MESISPQTTLCLSNPALFLSTKKPSRPATKSLHSSPRILQTVAACLVCSLSIPNITHLPILALISDSHLAFLFDGDLLVEY
jgi:hypothetical protein